MGSYGNITSTTGSLAATGAGVAIGHYYIGSVALAAIAVGMVGVGAIAIRLGFRRGKTVGEQ